MGSFDDGGCGEHSSAAAKESSAFRATSLQPCQAAAKPGSASDADARERGGGQGDDATGFKPKAVKTRLGALAFDVSQVRNGGFRPGAVAKGCPSLARENHLFARKGFDPWPPTCKPVPRVRAPPVLR